MIVTTTPNVEGKILLNIMVLLPEKRSWEQIS